MYLQPTPHHTQPLPTPPLLPLHPPSPLLWPPRRKLSPWHLGRDLLIKMMVKHVFCMYPPRHSILFLISHHPSTLPHLITPHPSPLTPHPSPLTPHPSPLTPHPSPLTPHPSPHCFLINFYSQGHLGYCWTGGILFNARPILCTLLPFPSSLFPPLTSHLVYSISLLISPFPLFPFSPLFSSFNRGVARDS